MATSPAVRGQDIQAGPYGEMPMVIHSGLLDTVTEVTEQSLLSKLIPFGATIEKIWVRVRVAGGTGSAVVKVGKQGDDDYFGLVTVPTTAAAGTLYDVTLLASKIAPFDVLTFAADGGATSTGSVDVAVVLRPGA